MGSLHFTYSTSEIISAIQNPHYQRQPLLRCIRVTSDTARSLWKRRARYPVGTIGEIFNWGPCKYNKWYDIVYPSFCDYTSASRPACEYPSVPEYATERCSVRNDGLGLTFFMSVTIATLDSIGREAATRRSGDCTGMIMLSVVDDNTSAIPLRCFAATRSNVTSVKSVTDLNECLPS